MATGTVMSGMFIAAMESLIGSTTLPTIVSSLGAIELFPWVISCFLLALVVATPLFGKLADHWGFFKVYIAAIALFFIGSLFCGLAFSMPQLILARSIQGVGTAGLITLCILYVGIAYSSESRPKMQALISSVWAIASLCGPAIGAFSVNFFSWRFAFLINIPFCILIFIGSFLFLKNLPRTKVQAPFDTLGAVLFTLNSLLLLYCLVQVGKLQNDLSNIALFSFSCLFIIYLLRRSSHKKDAFPSLEPLKMHPELKTSIALGFLGGAFLFSSANFLPIFVQGVQGDSMAALGEVVTGMALGTCFGSCITALILNQVGFRVASLLGSVFISSGLISLSLLSEDSSLFIVILGNFIMGTGIGISANVAIVATQKYSDANRLGATTSMFSFFRSLGGMLAVTLLGAIQLGSFRYTLGEKMTSLFQQDALQVMQHPEYILEPLRRPELSHVVMETLAGSLEYSIHLAFLFLLPFMVLHFWLSFRLPNVLPQEISSDNGVLNSSGI
jgi:MFS family permease